MLIGIYFLFFSLIFEARFFLFQIPVFLWIAVFLFFMSIVKYKLRYNYNIVLMATFLFTIVISFYVLFAFFISGNLHFLSQISIHFVVPILGLLFGSIFWQKKLQYIIYMLYIPLSFAIVQIVGFYFNISDYFGIFSKLRAWDLEVQQGYNDSYILVSRAIGTFINPNTLGFFFLLYFWLCSVVYKKFSIHHFCCIAGIVLSGSRGTLFAFLVALFFTSLVGGRIALKIKNMTYLLFFSLLAVLFIPFIASTDISFLNRFSELSEVAQNGTGKSENLLGRMDAWHNIVDYVNDNFFGTVMPPQTVISDSPDSQFFYFLAQGGWPLGISYILYVLFLFWYAMQLDDHKFNYEKKIFLGILLSLALNGLTMATMNTNIIFIFYFVMGTCLSSIRKKTRVVSY